MTSSHRSLLLQKSESDSIERAEHQTSDGEQRESRQESDIAVLSSSMGWAPRAVKVA